MQRPPLPNKPYFRIGEVAELLGVEAYVLRYWEGEFPQLSPVRAPSRQRLYRRADVETLCYIKQLLHEEGYTIAGAKRKLAEAPAPGPAAQAAPQASPAAPPPQPGGTFSLPFPEPPSPAQPPAPDQAVPPAPVVREVLGELRELLKILS